MATHLHFHILFTSTVYTRPLPLPVQTPLSSDAVSKLPNPKELFTALYHRCLCEGDWELHTESRSTLDGGVQELCLRAMATVYHTHAGVNFLLPCPACSSHVLVRDVCAKESEMSFPNFRSTLATNNYSMNFNQHNFTPLAPPTGLIGPFDGLPHLVRVLDATARRPIRERALQLLHALVMPQAGSPQVWDKVWSGTDEFETMRLPQV